MDKTVISREYSSEWKPGNDPYYLVNDEKNGTLYEKYRELAEAESNVIFGGRLGSYIMTWIRLLRGDGEVWSIARTVMWVSNHGDGDHMGIISVFGMDGLISLPRVAALPMDTVRYKEIGRMKTNDS